MKESNKLIFIGAIKQGQIPDCGETVKNQLFLKRFNELFDKVIAVDTYQWQKHPLCLVKLFIALLFNRGAKVIISACESSKYIISFLYHIPLKKDVYFWVVGAALPELVKQGKFSIPALKSLKAIIVQGKPMMTELAKFGITNTIYVPNSKPLEYVSEKKRKLKDSGIFRFVFLSRIHPEKGIKEIFEAVSILKEEGLSNKLSVDFYGKIDESIKQEFNKRIEEYDNVEYKGFLNLLETKGYDVLADYDCMVFPTYYSGEGFPGVVLDANISGVPIIATDWHLNNTVIEDNVNGVLIPTHDSKVLAVKMKEFVEGKYDLEKMAIDCVNFAKQFDNKKVISKQLMEELGLLKN